MHSNIWHPYTRFSEIEKGLPIIQRGEGIYLYDNEGIPWVDAISSWWCCNLGHSHPRIVQAIQQQTSQLQHSIIGNLTHPNAIQLAERLAKLMPTPDRHVLYASDGASANEAAIKVAVQYFHNIGQSQRNGFISLANPYHGDTIGTVSVGYMEAFHKPIKPLLFDCTPLNIPQTGQGPHRCSPAHHTIDQAAFDNATKTIQAQGPTLAAVMVESLCQGASGMRMYSAAYLEHLAALCKKVGCLLIVDEIAMGCGRTGKMWAFQHSNIDPDIMCVGKGITAGTLPLSATIVKDHIHATFADDEQDHTFYHGHTFAGNPIACAAGLAALDVYAEENLPQQAQEKGQTLFNNLAELSTLPKVKEVRSLGMILVVDFHKTIDAQTAKHRLLQEHILCRPLDTALYLMLPLTTSDIQLYEISKRFASIVTGL